MTGHAPYLTALFESVARRARHAGVFASVSTKPDMLECAAKDCPEPAFYRLVVESGQIWVALVTPHRYLSQSIEQDLVHSGDKMHELIQDELSDQGVAGPCGPVEHYRSPDKLYTFRTPVPISTERPGDDAEAAASAWLLAMEAAFRPLGDMSAGAQDQ